MPNTPKPPESLDFEWTDLDEARQVLDRPPETLVDAERLAPDFWIKRRRAPTPTDRALTGEAMSWVVGLPSELRPLNLCERYPRIANALAQAWPMPSSRAELLTELLRERRGGRRGFAVAVRIELERLRDHVAPDSGV